MQSLKDMSIKILFQRIIQRPIEEIEDDRVTSTLKLMDYFDEVIAGQARQDTGNFLVIRDVVNPFFRLLWPPNLIGFLMTKYVPWLALNIQPRTDRTEMMKLLNYPSFWDGSVRRPEAWDVALFLDEEQKELKLEFTSPNFDLDFLLRVCGHKLKNLTSLKLPEGCTLTAKTCKKMCQTMPKLEILDISHTVVEDDAAKYIARLPLVDLSAEGTNKENFVRQLCAQNSTLRKTLQYFKLSHEFPTDCYCLILNTMKSICHLATSDSRWLKALLPIGAPPQHYNLRMLVFRYPGDDIENELEIGALTCPEVSTIDITPKVLTMKMLQTLTKFKELCDLWVDMSYDSEQNDAFDRVCLRALRFDKLSYVVLDDPNDRWVTSGYLFDLLATCPELTYLTLSHCRGFSDKIAHELADLIPRRDYWYLPVNFSLRSLRFRSGIASPALPNKLGYLEIIECNSLGPSGIEDLVRMGSVEWLYVCLRINEVRRQEFDVDGLKRMAEEHGVDLLLEFLPWDEDAN